jgi:hypothetical protein
MAKISCLVLAAVIGLLTCACSSKSEGPAVTATVKSIQAVTQSGATHAYVKLELHTSAQGSMWVRSCSVVASTPSGPWGPYTLDVPTLTIAVPGTDEPIQGNLSRDRRAIIVTEADLAALEDVRVSSCVYSTDKGSLSSPSQAVSDASTASSSGSPSLPPTP